MIDLVDSAISSVLKMTWSTACEVLLRFHIFYLCSSHILSDLCMSTEAQFPDEVWLLKMICGDLSGTYRRVTRAPGIAPGRTKAVSK